MLFSKEALSQWLFSMNSLLFVLQDMAQCATQFLCILIFAVFAVSSAIRKEKFPPKKITARNFPAKMYSI